MRIEAVEVLRVTSTAEARAFAPERMRARPSDAHIPEPARTPSPSPGRETALFARISAEGAEGLYGPIGAGAAAIILAELAPLLRGADALAGARLWDRMATADHAGRRGEFRAAVGALDCALWDLRGVALGLPVHRLLGGPARDALPCYASMMDFATEPEAAARRAAEVVAAGFPGQKWFLAHGAADGRTGLAANLATLRAVREAVGPDHPLMLDAWTAWNLAYAHAACRTFAPIGLEWVEEPLPAHDAAAHAQLRRETGMAIAAGEHLTGTEEVLPFLRAEALDVVQFDIGWCGGITEALRIVALARAHGRPVIPHGGNLPATLAVCFALTPAECPWISYVLRLVPRQHAALRPPPGPLRGAFAPPELPGLGLALDPERCAAVEALRWP